LKLHHSIPFLCLPHSCNDVNRVFHSGVFQSWTAKISYEEEEKQKKDIFICIWCRCWTSRLQWSERRSDEFSA